MSVEVPMLSVFSRSVHFYAPSTGHHHQYRRTRSASGQTVLDMHKATTLNNEQTLLYAELPHVRLYLLDCSKN